MVKFFDCRGVGSLKISSVMPSGLGSRAPAECPMVSASGVRGFACWWQNCTTAKAPGGAEMVRKWSGFPGARVYDPQKHNDSPGGEPKSVQNQSGIGGAVF